MSTRKPKTASSISDLPKTLPRVQLDSLQRFRREMTLCYREAKFGYRNVDEAYKLVAMLQMAARLLAEHEFEQRLLALEKAAGGQGPQP